MSVTTTEARLFLALWPDAATRDALSRHAAAWHWPHKVARVQDEKLHLTLHFLGNVARERVDELRRVTVPFQPFALQFGHDEVWPHGIAVLQPHVAPPALLALHATLGDALRGMALPVDGRPYRPHVTLARRAEAAVLPAQAPSIEWQVEAFALVESQFDAHRSYTVLARYAHTDEMA